MIPQKVYKTAQEVKEKIEGYQAVWRVYASLAAMLYSNTPSGLFWNATNWTSEGFLRAGFKDAFEKAIKSIRPWLNIKAIMQYRAKECKWC